MVTHTRKERFIFATLKEQGIRLQPLHQKATHTQHRLLLCYYCIMIFTIFVTWFLQIYCNCLLLFSVFPYLPLFFFPFFSICFLFLGGWDTINCAECICSFFKYFISSKRLEKYASYVFHTQKFYIRFILSFKTGLERDANTYGNTWKSL